MALAIAALADATASAETVGCWTAKVRTQLPLLPARRAIRAATLHRPFRHPEPNFGTSAYRRRFCVLARRARSK